MAFLCNEQAKKDCGQEREGRMSLLYCFSCVKSAVSLLDHVEPEVMNLGEVLSQRC